MIRIANTPARSSALLTRPAPTTTTTTMLAGEGALVRGRPLIKLLTRTYTTDTDEEEED